MSMPLEGFDVLVGLRILNSFLGFHSPGNSDSALMFGVSNGSSNTVSPVQPCMNTMPLLVGVEVFCCQSSRHEIELIHVGLNGPIDNGVDAASSAWTCCSDVLECDMLIKGLREFILCPLRRQELLEAPLLLWGGIRELPVTKGGLDESKHMEALELEQMEMARTPVLLILLWI